MAEKTQKNVEAEVVQIVQELTREVISQQPSNIYGYCAKYLEKKLKKRDENCKSICYFFVMGV